MNEPCDLHELTNCSVCTGRDKAFTDSLEDPEGDRSAPLPVIPGGPTIYANYAGACEGCGRRYPKDAVIHHPKDGPGWVLVECCASAFA